MSEAVPVAMARDRALVEATVASWKDSLLDLSSSNPLIALPASGVLEMAAPNEIFDPLVRRRKAINYWDLSQKSLDRTVLRESGNYASRAAAIENLRQLHAQAVALLTGQDINVLFVSFGLLNWVDPGTGETIQSPLLIVPVHLEPRADGLGYTVVCMEEPAEVNPILKLRLVREDIGFTLPPCADERYLIPSQYLGNVTTAIAEREGWSVDERTVLGRFPLLKLRLYEDLTAQEDRALSHPLIAALAGQRQALSELPAVTVPSLADLEADDSSESQFLLLDADPAQERAIVAAARGQSFVLQGPPGTGKTQTITNIIGECAAAGKSILLVSGRMASLDAVHQRLADKGLGDLCLLAHSLKTSKRGILAQLESSLAAPVRATGGAAVRAARQKERDEIKSLRERLNTFTSALHTRREPLGVSVYDAAGIIAETEEKLGELSVATIPFTVREADRISESDFSAMLAQIGRLLENTAEPEEEGDALWIGAFVDSQRTDLAEATGRILRALDQQINRVRHAAKALAPLCGMPEATDLVGTERLLAVAESLLETKSKIGQSWLTGDIDPVALRNTAEDIAVRFTLFREERDSLLHEWDSTVLPLDHASLIERLGDKHAALLSPLLGEDWRDRIAAEFPNLSAVLDAVGQDGRTLHERLTYLAEKSGLKLDGDLDSRQRLLKVSRQAIDLPNPCVGWFAPGAGERLIGHLNDAQGQWERYRRGTEELFTYYSEDILDLAHNELLQTLETRKAGIGRLMGAFNNRVAGAMKAVTRPGANTKDRDPEADLTIAAEMKEVRRWCLQNNERFSNAFGSYYLGVNTDWNSVRVQIDKASSLASEFSDGRVPAPLIALMLLGDSDLKQFESVFGQVGALLAHLRDAWEKMSAIAVSPDALPDPMTPLTELTDWCDQRRLALTDLYEAYNTTIVHRRIADKDSAAPPTPVADVVRGLHDAQHVAETRKQLDAEFDALGLPQGPDYHGKDSEWTALFAALETAQRFRVLFHDAPEIPSGVTELLTGGILAEHNASLTAARAALLDEKPETESIFADLEELFREDYLTVGRTLLRRTAFDVMLEWVSERLNATDRLGSSLRVQGVRETCAALRLEGFYDVLTPEIAALPQETVFLLFRSGFYRAWTETVLSKTPGILPFTGDAQEGTIDRFRDLDRRQMDAVPGLIRELVRVRSPKQYPDEVKTLKGQLARRRTGEVRRLLSEIPNLVFALKPIVMMNPLSVRLFLDADSLRFDVVLFDDASQISTEDAIGAILRGKQVIIAGDPKQIPPLALLVESDRPFESILDAANGVADKMSPHFGAHALRWHYRSRNESLIAFSRRYFYPELVSFPSATVDSAIDYVDSPVNAETGIDDDGPARVVEAALAYAQANPEHSIGIVTLDDTDHERVVAEIARRKESDPTVALPHENEETGEGFFLKTLENVQGDERDMVVLYVGADPTRCKPLSAFGGERMLNVAITRARSRMIVVSAFAYDAPATEEMEHQGMLLLRSFLRYAREGVGEEGGAAPANDPAASLLLPGTHIPDVPAQSRFEEIVEQLLIAKGHQTRHQVGLSEYRVDLAIVDPNAPSRYLLGIEFDGPMYATGETARHRDRLRIDMLLDRGWHLHRVWALDWERDPKRELARIEAAITAAKKSASGTRPKARRSAKKDLAAEVLEG